MRYIQLESWGFSLWLDEHQFGAGVKARGQTSLDAIRCYLERALTPEEFQDVAQQRIVRLP